MASVKIYLRKIISKYEEGYKYFAEYGTNHKAFAPLGLYIFIKGNKRKLNVPYSFNHDTMKIVGYPEGHKKSFETFAERLRQLFGKIKNKKVGR